MWEISWSGICVVLKDSSLFPMLFNSYMKTLKEVICSSPLWWCCRSLDPVSGEYEKLDGKEQTEIESLQVNVDECPEMNWLSVTSGCDSGQNNVPFKKQVCDLAVVLVSWLLLNQQVEAMSKENLCWFLAGAPVATFFEIGNCLMALTHIVIISVPSKSGCYWKPPLKLHLL